MSIVHTKGMVDPVLQDLRDFFFDQQHCSPEAMGVAFAECVRRSDTWRNHSIFLYHAAKNATTNGCYGINPEPASEVLRGHLRAWTDKALKLKGQPPEAWMIPQVLTGFRMLRVRPPAKFVEYCERATARSLRLWNKGEILDWIGAVAELGIESNDTFLKQACERLVALSSGMQGHELYELARNMAIMDAVLEARRSAKTPHIANAFQKIYSSQATLLKIEQARATEEPQKLADALYWFSRKKSMLPRIDKEQNSGLQWLVAEQFRQAGAHPVERRVLKDTGHEIDLSFTFQGCNFDVEVDGPIHFIRCTDGHVITLDGRSVLQTMLLADKLPNQKIIRFPYTVYDEHVDSPEMWRELCQELKAAKPGAYLVNSDGHLTPKLLTKCRSDAGIRYKPA